ncbi:MAG: SCO7613 C-terminal domain-containing membrane protein, partial [Acidimicrobiales bacterium]
AGEHPLASVAVGLAGSVLLAEAAVLRWRVGERDPWSLMLAAASLVPAVVAALVAVNWYGPGAVLVAGAFVAWLLALSLDRAELGWLARLAGLALLAGVPSLSPADTAILAAVVAALAAVDAARRDEPFIAVGTSVATPVAIGALCLASGLSIADVGVALCVLGVVTAGLAAVVDDRWALPFLGCTGLAVAAGVVLAANDVRALADALLITGGLAIAAGLVHRVPAAELAGAAAATVGVWLRLDHAGVSAIEAYLAPVTVVLLAAGLRARQGAEPANSWEAYGPAVALLGVSALAERIGGGGGGHALIAGAVAVVAVAVGGWRRLAGPLVIGTGLLVAVTGYESLAVTASVPTHAWLALGGSVLLGAGIAMERADTGPLETGRRLVDVLRDRFA